MNNFVAIDVETANNHPTSICAIGAVKVIDGAIAARFYEFVRPEPNYYFRHFTENIHGISRTETDSADRFPDVWARVARFADNLPFVAHNKAFDEKCIRTTHQFYGIEYPEYPFFCTLAKARATIPRQICPSFSLPQLCSFLAIPFSNHHNALADAEGCAKIAMALL